MKAENERERASGGNETERASGVHESEGHGVAMGTSPTP